MPVLAERGEGRDGWAERAVLHGAVGAEPEELERAAARVREHVGAIEGWDRRATVDVPAGDRAASAGVVVLVHGRDRVRDEPRAERQRPLERVPAVVLAAG